jgi:hypothetical protein
MPQGRIFDSTAIEVGITSLPRCCSRWVWKKTSKVDPEFASVEYFLHLPRSRRQRLNQWRHWLILARRYRDLKKADDPAGGLLGKAETIIETSK